MSNQVSMAQFNQQVRLNRLVDSVISMPADAWETDSAFFTAQVKGHQVLLPYSDSSILDLAVDCYLLRSDVAGQYNRDRLCAYRIKLQAAYMGTVRDAVDNILKDFEPEDR